MHLCLKPRVTIFEGAGLAGQPWQDSPGQPDQDKVDGKVKPNITARTGQQGQERRERTALTGEPGQETRTGQPGPEN
jgi:hypothetical protein